MKYAEIDNSIAKMNEAIRLLYEARSELTAFVNENVYKQSELFNACSECEDALIDAIHRAEFATDCLYEYEDHANEKVVV